MKVWCAEYESDHGYGHHSSEFIGVFTDRRSAIQYVENEWPGRANHFVSTGLPELNADGWGDCDLTEWVALWEADVISTTAMEPASK